MNRKVSVIIPTLNSWDTLKICLNSLKNQTVSLLEIIVVDNGSWDQTSKKVKKNFPKVKLITLGKNTGVTGGRNVGIIQASKKSDYILFFDHDMVAEKKMIGELVKIGESVDDFGIVTPKIFYYQDKSRVWAAGTNINLWTGQILFRGGEDMGQFQNVEQVQVAPAAFLVKKKVLDKLKGFDERYFATYEDTDFCFRAQALGFKTIYAPLAVAYHQLSPKVSDDRKRLIKRSFWVGRNRVFFMKDFGKSFMVFLMFSPLYWLYFLFMSIREKDLTGIKGYTAGFMKGLLGNEK